MKNKRKIKKLAFFAYDDIDVCNNFFNEEYMQEFIGLIGSLCFAFSSWPQAYYSWRKQSAKGVKWSFILLWLSGSIFSTIYATYYHKYVLLINYLCGAIGTLVILYVKIEEFYKEKGCK